MSLPVDLPAVWFAKAEQKNGHRQNGHKEFSEILRDGERREFFLSSMGALRQNGMGEEMMQTAMSAVAADHCDPPWSEQKVEKMAADVAKRYPAGKPIPVIHVPSLRSHKSQDGDWPDPMGEAAYHGVVGQIVRKIRLHTEADDHAVLLQFLVGVGNAAGRMPHVNVEADRHGSNMFLALVGTTSSSRKGTSFGQARRPIALADPHWAETRQASGLSSGEGLIYVVRDADFKTKIQKNDDGEEEEVRVLVDAGVDDKRLLVVEAEFASALKVATREGNTLSPLIRQAWDGIRLQTLTRNSPMKASNPHISIIAHITPAELRRELRSSEVANGFANRFMVALAKRSKLLPFGGNIESEDFSEEIATIKRALGVGRFRRQKAMPIDGDARDLWKTAYSDLVKDRPGQLGNLLARAPSHVLRMSLVYALLDQSSTIKAVHLQAALAVWRYVEQSTAIVFQTATGDPLADRLHDLLRDAGPDGLTRTEIRDRFDRHRTGGEIDNALKTLADNGLARMESKPTGGRPVEQWSATKATKATKGDGS